MSARYLTLAQVADRLSTPPETVRYWVYLGKLAAFKPGRQVLVREDDLETFVAASAVCDVRAARAKRTRKVRAA